MQIARVRTWLAAAWRRCSDARPAERQRAPPATATSRSESRCRTRTTAGPLQLAKLFLKSGNARGDGSEGLVDVVNKVVDVFEANRQTNSAFGDCGHAKLFGCEITSLHHLRSDDQRLG